MSEGKCGKKNSRAGPGYGAVEIFRRLCNPYKFHACVVEYTSCRERAAISLAQTFNPINYGIFMFSQFWIEWGKFEQI